MSSLGKRNNANPWAMGSRTDHSFFILEGKRNGLGRKRSGIRLKWHAIQREKKWHQPQEMFDFDPSLNCQHNVSIWQTKANNKQLFPSTPRTRGTKPWTKELFVSSSVFFTHHFKAQGYLHTISLRNICQLYCLIWSAGLLCSQWAYQSLPFLVFLGTAIISSGEVAISFPRFAGGKEVLIP